MNKKAINIFSIFFILFVFTLPSCKKDEPKNEHIQSAQNSQKKRNKKDIQRTDLKFVNDTAFITNVATINTSLGKIKIALFGKDAPNTVKNFIGLARKGYYNGVLFHRVAKNFLIQSGDGATKNQAKKSEWGKGGKSIWDEEFDDELDDRTPSYKIGYVKGTVAMANRGPNTNTSQFFICLDEAKKLQKKWTIFGKVIEGLDVVGKIADSEIIPGPFEQNDGIPKKPIKIFSVSITSYE